MTRVVYVYGFVAPDAPPPPDDLVGVAGRPVETIEIEGLVAAVSRVPEDEFGETELQDRTRDLEWIGREGARHERVVTWFVDRSTILPARFLTLHSGEEALRNSVAERAADLRARIRELDGLREWDLKIGYDAERLAGSLGSVSEAVAELDRELEEAAPGRRYLLERKRSQVVQEQLGDEARRLAREVLDALRPLARDDVIVPPPREAGELPVVLNAALLLPRDGEDEARRRADEAADRLAPLGMSVTYSGPWAPYRFVEEDDDA